MVRLKDIAEDVGVSVSAVSRTLNPKPDRNAYVSDELRGKILKSADSFGFKRNRMAEFLKRGRSSAIGVFIPGTSNRLVADLLLGISQEAAQLDFPLNFYFGTTPDNSEEYERFIANAMGRSSSGIITYFYTHASWRRDKILAMIGDYNANGGHTLFLNTYADCLGMPRLYNDDALGGKLAAERLASRKPGKLLCENSIFPERTKGFTQEAARRGYEAVLYELENFASTFKKALRGAGALPLGVFACTDLGAYEIMTQVRKTGLPLGEDVLLVGYDDLEFCEFTEPKLTTVRQNFKLEGRRAVQKLVNMIYGKHEEDEAVAPTLVIRETA